MDKIFKRINYILIVLIVLTLPLGVIPRIPLSGFIIISLTDILASLAAFNFVIYFLIMKPALPVIFKSFIPFLIIAFVSLILSLRLLPFGNVVIGGLYFVRLFVYSLLIPSVSCLESIQKKKIVLLLLISGLMTAIFGIIQYFLYPDLRNLYYLGFDPHYKRIFGTYGDPNFIGMIFVLTLLLSFYKASLAQKKEKILFSLIAVFVFISLAFTYSRSSYLALIFASLVYTIIRKKLKIFIVTVVIIGAAVLILPRPGGEGVRLERTASTLARVDNFRKTFEIFSKNPFFGVGFDNYRFAQKNAGLLGSDEFSTSHAGSGADNSFMFILATTGIFGFMAFVYFLYRIFKIGDILITVSAGAWLVHSLFVNSLFFIPLVIWMFILLGAKVKDYS